MRTLRFIVEKQILKPDPDCDFENLVPGTENYLQAEFIFSPEWNGVVKVAAFYSAFGKEHDPQTLKSGRTCIIPKEAVAKRNFSVQVFGKGNDVTMTTNKILVKQNGG